MKPRFTPNLDRREKIAALTAYVAKLGSPGAGQRLVLTAVEIEQATGVHMDQGGRALFRLVLRRARRPYLSIPGGGFELSSPDNALEIVEQKGRRVVNAIGRAKETTEIVTARHIEEMSQENKNRLLHVSSILSAVDLSRSLAKRLPAKKD